MCDERTSVTTKQFEGVIKKSRSRRIFFNNQFFDVFSRVYIPSEDTFLFLDNLEININDVVLDLGTGCGILAIVAALKAKKVIAIDINPYAVICANHNAKINKVNKKVSVIRGDLFNPLKRKTKFDLILFNAPYLPIKNCKPKSWIDYAWNGGTEGRQLIDRFLKDTPKFMNFWGRTNIVQSTLSNLHQTLRNIREMKLHCEIIAEKKLAFEKIVLIETKFCNH